MESSKRGATAPFDDSVGGVNGTWVVGHPPSPQPGLLFYILVDSVAETLEAIVACGGEVVQRFGRGCSRSYRSISRPGRKRDWALSGACPLRESTSKEPPAELYGGDRL